MYFTDFETSHLDRPIWFWTPDTLYGTVRSNDFIGIKYSPHFYGRVITSQDRFIEFGASPYFEYEPIFNAPLYHLPESYPHLIDQATLSVETRGGRLMTWIHLEEGGVDVFLYPLGTPRADSLYVHMNPPDRAIIYVDGPVEVEGVLAGTLTVYSTGNIWLIDNVRYTGANRTTGWFDSRPPSQMRHMLGLVSEQNIIIKDNIVNGQGDGWNLARGDRNRNSIIINAALVSLGGSFTFEHQNNQWELYQGPTPDERGYIYLVGSVAQRRKGYVHRSNHVGTGYGKSYNFDFRFHIDGPPGFGVGEYPEVEGRYGDLHLSYREYTFRNAVVENLTVDPGVTSKLDGHNALTVLSSLTIDGEAESPVIFQSEHPGQRTLFRLERGARPIANVRHTQFSRDVEVHWASDSIKLSQCRFDAPVRLQGNILTDSSFFTDRVSLISWGQMHVQRSVFTGGLVIDGNVRDGLLINNTITDAHRDGVVIRRFMDLTLVNNIIAFNEAGIVNDHYLDPLLVYNDVYENRDDDYSACEPGEGSISADPLLSPRRSRRARRLDFCLDAGSPCIDAGDPASPRDPDGSCADMGAVCFVHEVGVSGDDVMPVGFALSASPNPFNRCVMLNITVDQARNADISVFDLQGRCVYDVTRALTTGRNTSVIDGQRLGGAGVYFVLVIVNDKSRSLKLLYLP